jgi:hypothetical protein
MDDAIFRDFDAEMQETKGVPVRFKLGGHTFDCVSPLPIGSTVVFARHALGMNSSPEAQLEASSRIANILWSFVVPEQHALLDEVFATVTDPLMVEKLTEFIITASTGRPTQGS